MNDGTALSRYADTVVRKLTSLPAPRFRASPNYVHGYVYGWGPDLARTTMAWELRLPEETEEALDRAIAPYVEVQNRRADAARSLGLGAGHEPPRAGAVDHLVVDRVLDDMVADRDPFATDTLRRRLGEFLAGSARRSIAIDGLSDHFKKDGVVIRDGTRRDPRPRVMVYQEYDRFAFDGEMLVVAGAQVPETVIPHIAGVRVGEIVKLPHFAARRLRDRRVLGAEQLTGALVLRTEAQWIPLPERD